MSYSLSYGRVHLRYFNITTYVKYRTCDLYLERRSNMFRFVALYCSNLCNRSSKRFFSNHTNIRSSEFQLFCNMLTCSNIWFRFVPPSIVTHTGSYKQRNETEQKSCDTKTYYYISLLESSRTKACKCYTRELTILHPF